VKIPGRTLEKLIDENGLSRGTAGIVVNPTVSGVIGIPGLNRTYLGKRISRLNKHETGQQKRPAPLAEHRPDRN
jgi:hypothetical protein